MATQGLFRRRRPKSLWEFGQAASVRRLEIVYIRSANVEDNPLAISELHELERAECLLPARLAARSVGRVHRWRVARGEPVAYHFDDEEVVFRTKNGSKLAAATRHAVVGFEVDDFDLEARTGWSVLGVGEAYEIVDPARLAASPTHIPTRGCRDTMPTQSRSHYSSSPVAASSPIPRRPPAGLDAPRSLPGPTPVPPRRSTYPDSES